MISRYNTISNNISKENKKIFNMVYYPEIPISEDDSYIITSVNDRLDLIAFDFWGQTSWYWIIAVANNLECDSLYPPVGIQLRIPYNTKDIINLYTESNN